MTYRLIILFWFAVASVYADEVQAPSLEFLEFMGEWESSDGQWQDPIELSNMNDVVDEAEARQRETQTTSEESRNDQ